MDRYKFQNLHKYFKAPEGSEVVMTPNAFMNYEAWLEIIPKLCKLIQRQEIIRDHPDWWVLLSLDGFTSHVNVLNAHEIFAEFKIMVMKEEGDKSHVCQAYDHQVPLIHTLTNNWIKHIENCAHMRFIIVCYLLIICLTHM